MPAASHRSCDIGFPLTRSSLAVISETTSPAPRDAAKRRNGASVMPDMGAKKTRPASSISPIFNGLWCKESSLLTDFSLLSRVPLPAGIDCCAQILCSQVSCLHFRQSLQSCKCTATKYRFFLEPPESFCLPGVSAHFPKFVLHLSAHLPRTSESEGH